MLSVVSYVAGQLLVKHAMDATGTRRFAPRLATGIAAMTVSFFLTLGLLQSFDLSYLYPFQGLSVITISLLAAFLLKEKLSPRLIVGAALITIGVVLVSIS